MLKATERRTQMETETRQKTYEVNIEGAIHVWHEPTITPAEIRQLASFADDQPIIEVDLRDNSERTLSEGEAVALSPGKTFAKKVRFQRG
jgi:hypothetical protein